MTDLDPEALLSPRDAAALIGIRADTLSRWAREGVLPSQLTRPGGHRRFKRRDVEALIQTGDEAAKASA